LFEKPVISLGNYILNGMVNFPEIPTETSRQAFEEIWSEIDESMKRLNRVKFKEKN